MTSTLWIYSFNIQQDFIKDPLNLSDVGTVIGGGEIDEWDKGLHVPGASEMDGGVITTVWKGNRKCGTTW